MGAQPAVDRALAGAGREQAPAGAGSVLPCPHPTGEVWAPALFEGMSHAVLRPGGDGALALSPPPSPGVRAFPPGSFPISDGSCVRSSSEQTQLQPVTRAHKAPWEVGVQGQRSRMVWSLPHVLAVMQVPQGKVFDV